MSYCCLSSIVVSWFYGCPRSVLLQVFLWNSLPFTLFYSFIVQDCIHIYSMRSLDTAVDRHASPMLGDWTDEFGGEGSLSEVRRQTLCSGGTERGDLKRGWEWRSEGGAERRNSGGQRDVNKGEGEEHDSAFTVGRPLRVPDPECLEEVLSLRTRYLAS